MKSPIISRRALVDIGASGPIAGFIVALFVTIYGLSISKVVPLEAGTGGIILGDSLLFSLLSKVILGTTPEGKDIMLHPVAFAGWIGFFVTAMNLLPIGQLDGGHTAYALFGEKNHKKLSITLAVILALAGLLKLLFYNVSISLPIIHTLMDYLWEGWAIWAFLLFMLGLKHPPVIYWERSLEKSRRFIGWLALVIFILTFTPVPFRMF
jgi:membrane-associated protease RseP (regulator of RpoE activity)